MTFRLPFFLLTLALFIIEVLIALFVHDRFVRPYAGDYLVVILLYCAAKTVFDVSPLKIGIGVLLFSYLIEVLQYFKFVDRVGLGQSELAKTVLGSGFSWLDLLAYTLGVATMLVLEKRWPRNGLNADAH